MKMAAQSAADVASSAARADGASVEDAGGDWKWKRLEVLETRH